MTRKKTIFITGAASGIGRETALLFARKGWYTGIADIDEPGIRSLAARIGGDNCFAGVMDVTAPDRVREVMAAFAKETNGTLDVLFNNAGLLCFGHFEKTDLGFENRIVDVNIKGLLNCTKAAIPYLKATEDSCLINMASTSAVYGIPDLSVYSATKHAVCALTQAWDIELEPYGIHVTDILAPFVRTPLLDTGETVHSVNTMGVKLMPGDIAKTVWKAANHRKRRWMVGGSTPVLFSLFRLAPFIRRTVIKKLTIQ